MTPDRWRQVEQVLDAALDLPTGERAAYVDLACGSDAGLRAEVERLLAACDAPDDRLAAPAAVFAAPLIARPPFGGYEPPAERGPPTRVGPYRILHAAGQGGMGVVYAAERDDGQFRKRVALKLVRRGLHLDARFVRRFLEERRILARLEHPNVARLLDGGVADDGLPYYVMEYVDGAPIDAYCDARCLTIEARLALFARVCDAVAYAHEHRVVHRDLKPSNVLVTDAGEPKLVDFGIAKLLHDALARTDELPVPSLTHTGQRLLTPEYASPEQIRGEPVTEASDVYALGVLLYELLAGRRPFTRGGRPAHEVERAILEQEPARPSAAVLRADDPAGGSPGRDPATVGAARGLTPERLGRRLRGDLDAIVLTALRKEPERRYAGVGALADDVRRHLDGRPVATRGDGVGYRLRKWARRHRVSVAAALGGVAAGVAAIVIAAPRAPVLPPAVAAGTVGEPAPAPVPVIAVGTITDYRPAGAAAGSGSVAQLRDMLGTNLARVPGVRVVSTARLLELTRQAGGAADAFHAAAERSGATLVVDGALYAADGELRLDLRRTAIADGAVKGALTVRGGDLFALVDSGTARLAADLDAAAPVGSIAGVTTRSHVAYGFYAEGLRTLYHDDPAAALRLFDAALREDSSFAMAAYYGARAAPFRLDQVPRIKHAVQLAARVSERERLLIRGWHAYLMWDPGLGAIADTLIRRYPEETDGHLYAGIARRLGDDFLGALPPLRRVLAMDSLSATDDGTRCSACDATQQIVHAYLTADSLPAAEREARQWIRLQPTSVAAWRMLWDVLVSQDRYRDAEAIERRLVALDPSPAAEVERTAVSRIRMGDFAAADAALRGRIESSNRATRLGALWYLVTSLRHQGRLAEAEAVARRYRAEGELPEAPDPGSASSAALPLAQVLHERGRHRQAAALFDSVSRWRLPADDAPSAVAYNRGWSMTHASAALAAAGDTAALVARIDTLAALGAQTLFGRVRPLHHFVRGLLLARRDRPADAEAELRQAIWSPTHGYTRVNLELARVLLQLDRPREAAALVEAALRGKLDASGLYTTHTELHEMAGRAWAAAGEPARAVPHYRYVVTAWRRADPAFAARRRAALVALGDG